MRAVSAAAVCALVATVMECVPVPQTARILPGVLEVFFLPGFAVVSAVLPARDMSVGGHLLASVGASVAITVCASTLLGATVGLAQRSIALALGALTLVAFFFAWLRERQFGRSDAVELDWRDGVAG